MDFDEFAKKFGGRLKEGDVLEARYSIPDVDGQKGRELYYYLGWVPGEVGRTLSVCNPLKKNNHSPLRLVLEELKDLRLYLPAD